MSNFFEIGDVAYSYQTCIRAALPDGTTLGNATRYSMTTSRHQNQAGVKGCDIQLYNVPRGTTDLVRYYMEHVYNNMACKHCNHRRDEHLATLGCLNCHCLRFIEGEGSCVS